MEKVRWSIAAKGAAGLRRDRTTQPYKPKVQPDTAIKGPKDIEGKIQQGI